ncbi:MAG: hypothetical protein FJ038_13795, partial [Chloroflexi bacterium]|nr:hypothetical protein [Chloroflexota bacterium]
MGAITRRNDPAGHDLALDGALASFAGLVPGEATDQPGGRVAAVRHLPARAAAFAPFPDTLDPRLRTALADRGIDRFYVHQAEAYAHVAAGRHVVITTPTASGKTLCYN